MTEVIPPQPQSGLELIPGYGLIAIEIILALGIGLSFIVLGVGEGSWILGGIAAGALAFYCYRLRVNSQAEPNRNFRKLGQILIGLTVGFSVHFSNLIALPVQLPVFGLLILFLLVSSGAIGYFFAWLEKTDLLTALLAAVPGNIGIMASVAADYGKNTSLVSLVQLLRFTTVTLVIPMLAHVSNTHDVGTIFNALTQDFHTFALPYYVLLSLILALAFFAVQLGSKIKIPVAAFFCPIALGIAFNLLLGLIPSLPLTSFNLPTLFKVVGQILLGLTIGEYWGLNPKLKGLTVVHAIAAVGLTLLAGLMAAGLAKLLMPWDWLTCLLVTAPGGSPEMIWIALALNHDVELITAGHLIRLMAINLSLPVLVSFAAYLENRLTDRPENVF